MADLDTETFRTVPVRNAVYDPNLLAWVSMQQPIIQGSAISIGTVNQGVGASASPWTVTITNVPVVISI